MKKIKYQKGFTVYFDNNVSPRFFFEQSIELNNHEDSLAELNIITNSIKSTVQLLNKIKDVIIGELYEYEYNYNNRVYLIVDKEETTVCDYLYDINIIISNDEFIEILEDRKRFLKTMKTIDFRSLVREAIVKLKANPTINEYGFYGTTINNGMLIQFALIKETIENIAIEEYLPTLKIPEIIFEE